jgi:hypothetical protein
VPDGCGGTLSCGTCALPKTCGGAGTANVCGCTPSTCESLGKNCGQVSDGCGAMLDCGACLGAQTCGGGGTPNVCGPGACVPRTCADVGAECGTMWDGCAGHVDCAGGCSGAEACGAGGIPNRCGTAIFGLCGACPAGFSQLAALPNNACSPGACGSQPQYQAACYSNAIPRPSLGCGLICLGATHVGATLDNCRCSSGKITVCLPNN